MSDRAVVLTRSALVSSGFVIGLILCARLADLDGIVLYVAYAGVGSYLAIRRPRNSIGWLLVVTGWALGGGSIRITETMLEAQPGTPTPWEAIPLWVSGWFWAGASWPCSLSRSSSRADTCPLEAVVGRARSCSWRRPRWRSCWPSRRPSA